MTEPIPPDVAGGTAPEGGRGSPSAARVTITIAVITAVSGIIIALINQLPGPSSPAATGSNPGLDVAVQPGPTSAVPSLVITNIPSGSSPRDGDDVDISVAGAPDPGRHIWFLARLADQDGRPWFPQGPCGYVSATRARCDNMQFGAGRSGTPLDITAVLVDDRDSAVCVENEKAGFPPGEFPINPIAQSPQIRVTW